MIDEEPKSIISFDSHLYIYFSGGPKFLTELLNIPFPLGEAFLRTNVHAILKRALRDVPLFLVVPETCFINHAHSMVENAKKISGAEMTFQSYLDYADHYIRKMLGIRLFLSPPKNIKYLYEDVSKHSTVVDVDYMQEFQNVCYSKAPQLMLDSDEVTRLGTLNEVIKTINKVRPQLVLISEVRLDQITDLKPPLKQLVEFLRNQGYLIEKGELVDSDKTAFQSIKLSEEFTNEILPSIQKKRLLEKISLESLNASDSETCKALRRFLKEKNAIQ